MINASSPATTLPLAKTMEGLSYYDDFGDYKVPTEVIARIFSYLPSGDLYDARGACRTWYVIASNQLTLPRLFPGAPVVNQGRWDAHVDLKKHGLVFEPLEQPRLYYKSDYMELSRIASEVEKSKIKEREGISFLTLPKGLTVNKIIAIVGAPKMGNSTQFGYICGDIIAKYGDKKIEKTVIVAITNGIFNNSCSLSVDQQMDLVKGLKCDMLKLVAVMALTIMRYISSDPASPLRLFGNDPFTFTRCAEEIRGFNCIFGSFGLPGPYVSFYPLESPAHGAGGQRKLEGDRY